MHDWEEMASVVGRKLVENGQTRILQRIYDGITSNWVLDVADDKGSMNHLLIHLVWRKFPRNRHPTEDRSTVPTQTEEGSSASLGLDASADLTGLLPKTTISDSTQTTEDMRPGPRHISRNYVASISDCLSMADLGELFDANESPSNSDADWTSDCSLSSTDLAQELETSFMSPAKRRSGKPLSPEKKFQTQLSNRFDCLEEVNSPGNLYGNSDLSDRKSVTDSRGNRSRSPSKSVNKSKMRELSKTSTLKSSEIPTTSIINYDTEDGKRDVGTVDGLAFGFGTLVPDSCPGRSKTLLFIETDLHKKFGLKEGDKVTYIFQPSSGVDTCDVIDVQWFDNG